MSKQNNYKSTKHENIGNMSEQTDEKNRKYENM